MQISCLKRLPVDQRQCLCAGVRCEGGLYLIGGNGEKKLGGLYGCMAGVKPTYRLILELIVVIVDISAVPVRARVTRADGGVFIIVVLTTVVSGASMVHPVRQVSLQPLVRGTDGTS